MSIQVMAEFYMGDHAPAEAAETLSRLVVETMPSDPALGSLKRAWWQFRIAARVEDFELFTELMGMAKETCREIALVWLEFRECECCIALRNRLETKGKKGMSELWKR
jgi:hypothetical protein